MPVFFACKNECGTTKSLITHLQYIHKMSTSRGFFKCCDDGCARTFQNIHSFKKHLKIHTILIFFPKAKRFLAKPKLPAVNLLLH